MANALEEIFRGAGQAPVALSAEQKQKLYSAIGYTPGTALQKKQVQTLEKGIRKGTIEATAPVTDLLASAFNQTELGGLPGKYGKQFAKAGYLSLGDQFIKPVSSSQIRQAASMGIGETETRDYLAKQFAANQIEEQARKFMQPAYKTDVETGRYVKVGEKVIDVKGDGKDTAAEKPKEYADLSKTKSFLEGLNPDELPGYNTAEIDYATQIDPYKIQAKSSQKIAQIGQGTSLYNLIGYARP
jgi:hypothetical protein